MYMVLVRYMYRVWINRINRQLNIVLIQHIASLIGADPKEIIFTSGATEANNMSVKGVARFYRTSKKHLITTQIVSSVHCYGH